ncbi:MAG: NAD(P)H-dependent oxidoreductase [Henriciella sp.]|nr:NAD(P)H-dependent oxidoreductase [Henriciella sp.]
MANTILHLDSSARTAGSVSRGLTEKLVNTLAGGGATIIRRDIGTDALPIITEDWVNANFTPDENRTAEQQRTLALSDELIGDLEAADTLVLGVPIYNFGVPAAYKAWVDLISRARKTFQYTENGPEGLLKGKKAYVAIASGGTASDSDMDFATPYVRRALAFIGITDVTVIAADQLMMGGEDKIAAVTAQVEALAA